MSPQFLSVFTAENFDVAIRRLSRLLLLHAGICIYLRAAIKRRWAKGTAQIMYKKVNALALSYLGRRWTLSIILYFHGMKKVISIYLSIESMIDQSIGSTKRLLSEFFFLQNLTYIM
jgi:hypothetical protein